MAKPTNDVTPAELAVLVKLWEHEHATLKQLSKWLYGGDAPSKIATVQKLLSRLEAKAYVERNRECWPHQYRALVDRDQLISFRLQSTADQFCDGMMSTLLTHLIKSTKFNSRQRKRLRQILDEMEPE